MTIPYFCYVIFKAHEIGNISRTLCIFLIMSHVFVSCTCVLSAILNDIYRCRHKRVRTTLYDIIWTFPKSQKTRNICVKRMNCMVVYISLVLGVVVLMLDADNTRCVFVGIWIIVAYFKWLSYSGWIIFCVCVTLVHLYRSYLNPQWHHSIDDFICFCFFVTMVSVCFHDTLLFTHYISTY